MVVTLDMGLEESWTRLRIYPVTHSTHTTHTHTHTVVGRVSIVKFIVENNVEYVLIFDNEFNNESKKQLQSFWKKNVENHY